MTNIFQSCSWIFVKSNIVSGPMLIVIVSLCECVLLSYVIIETISLATIVEK